MITLRSSGASHPWRAEPRIGIGWLRLYALAKGSMRHSSSPSLQVVFRSDTNPECSSAVLTCRQGVGGGAVLSRLNCRLPLSTSCLRVLLALTTQPSRLPPSSWTRRAAHTFYERILLPKRATTCCHLAQTLGWNLSASTATWRCTDQAWLEAGLWLPRARQGSSRLRSR